MEFTPGMRVRFSDSCKPEQFGASPEEWASNPKTGTVIAPKFKYSPFFVFVKMDKEWSYNERDMMCWLQGEFEIMHRDELVAL